MKTNIETLYRARGYQPEDKTDGELCGPCPWCGGSKRFLLFLTEGKEDRGRYWCRECGQKGDALQFLRDLEGLSFREAQAALGIDPESFPKISGTHNRADKPSQAFIPKKTAIPGPVWQDRTGKLVTWANNQLLQNPQALAWLKESKGIKAETVRASRLGWIPQDIFRPRPAFGLPEEFKENGQARRVWIPQGLCIPVFHEDGRIHRVKFRLANPGPRQPKYIGLPQIEKSVAPLALEKPETRPWVILESELDAILLFQEAGQRVNVLAMGSASNRPDADTWAKLKAAPLVLVSLDADEAGGKSTYRWWRKNLDRGRFIHWPVPEGKDPGEAWESGWDLFTWIETGLKPHKY